MLESLVAALVSAFCYGVASVMQAIAVRSASRRPAHVKTGEAGPGVDPGLVVRLLRFAVQAMIAANLAVTAVFAAWLMHVRLSLREWLAVTGVVVGVGLLGASAGAEGATQVGFAFKLALIVAVAAVAVA